MLQYKWITVVIGEVCCCKCMGRIAVAVPHSLSQIFREGSRNPAYLSHESYPSCTVYIINLSLAIKIYIYVRVQGLHLYHMIGIL